MPEFLTNPNLLFYLAAYLLGGIPFGVILAKQFAGVDIRNAGSGNIGATNVLRVVKEKDPKLAKKLMFATFGFDAIKGAMMIGIAALAGMSEATLWMVGVLSVLGHCFSPFLKFEGGKGVATGVGVTLAMIPIEGLLGLGVWLLLAKTLKISSISSLLGVLTGVGSSFFIHPDMPHAPMVIIGFIIFYKHIPNIVRLVKGEEKRV
ncbi:MAG: glycerol-3-phosphate acyltransferase [Sulfuricurvum sp. PC08-66]|nr:MAG: glycerol-3-phosphate acyltransferase [Sulfuricurvum sp. PC08-66]